MSLVCVYPNLPVGNRKGCANISHSSSQITGNGSLFSPGAMVIFES